MTQNQRIKPPFSSLFEKITTTCLFHIFILTSPTVQKDNFLICQSQRSLRVRLIFQFRGIQFSFLLKLLTLKSHPRNGQFKSTTKRCLILDALIDRVQMGADLHGHQWAQVITYWLSSEAPGASQCPKCPKVHIVCRKDIALWKNLESYGFREIFEQRQNAFFLPRPEVGRVGQAAALGDSCF